MIEPDQGGSTLLDKLSESALRNRVDLIDLDEFKDPSGLYLDDPERFEERWAAAKAAATSLSDRLDAQARDEAKADWEACEDLARDPDILSRAVETVTELGVVGESTLVKLVFLAMVSRLFSRPVSIAVKGTSSAGKSFTVERTLQLFPEETYYALTAMSERAPAYSQEPLQHRMMVIYEAAGLSGDIASYLMRSLLSEGRIKYETVVKTNEGLIGKLIEREGPTGLITTTTAITLHPENETRLLSIPVSDSREQTHAIFQALATGSSEPPDLTAWHALQRWLAQGERRADIPFAKALAALMPPIAVRLRRDFGLVLTLIRAHALLHRASRACDSDGAILATLDDYEAVQKLVAPLIAAGIGATVPSTLRETVAVVRDLCPDPDDSASITEIGDALKLDKGAASRRVSAAREAGYLINREERKGRPAKIVIGEPLPEDTPILPDRCSVAAVAEGKPAPPPAPKAGGRAPLAKAVQRPRADVTGNAPKVCREPKVCGLHGPCDTYRLVGACPPMAGGRSS